MLMQKKIIQNGGVMSIIFEKPIKEIVEQDIRRLKESETPEDNNLEYKGSLDTSNKDHKRKILKTISSFANTNGGLLIYGIDEKNGIPSELGGIKVDNKDQLGIWIEDYIRGNSEPRIPSLEIEFINKTDSNNVFILVKVPRSWNLPHRVSMGPNTQKFYIRRGRFSEEMDYFELKNTFNLSETLVEKIRTFREERISSILSNETPIFLKNGAKIVLHIIPINAFYPGQKYEIDKIIPYPHRLKAMNAYYPSLRYNFDGLLGIEATSEDEPAYGYVQLYRNGIIESTSTEFFDNDNKLISNGPYEIKVVQSLSEYLETYKMLNVEFPIFIFLSIVGVKGYKMESNNELNSIIRTMRAQNHYIDRNVLPNSEILLSKYPENVSNVLKPAFDAIRNACGFVGSENYNEKGEWSPRRR